MPNVLLTGPGAWTTDEVRASIDPVKHANDLVATLKQHRFRWVAQQIETAHPALQAACVGAGFGYVTWSQSSPPADQIAYLRGLAKPPDAHVPNVETRAEESAWSDWHLDIVRGICAGNVGVAWTEGAWRASSAEAISVLQARAARWRSRGYVALPEADLVRNPSATPVNIWVVASHMLWAWETTSIICYIDSNKPVGAYEAEIRNNVFRRWSLYRYGDIGADDLAQIADWPVPDTPPPVPPPPPPTDPYDKLEGLVSQFRAGSPKIAAAFDEAVVQMRRVESS